MRFWIQFAGKFCLLSAFWAILFFASGCSRQPRIRIVIQQSSPVLENAARDVGARLQERGYQVEFSTGSAANAGLTDALILNVAPAGSGIKPESFEIAPIHANGYLLVRVTGADPRAALWGALEAADQIVARNELDSVTPSSGTPFLSIRASLVELPLGTDSDSPSAVLRESLQKHFDLLARNRFNAIFIEMRESLLRYTHFDDEESAFGAPEGKEERASIDWLQEVFRMARDRGLNPYLVLRQSAFAEMLAKPSSGPDAIDPNQPAAYAAPNMKSRLPRALPSLLETYPELAGVALGRDVQELAGPPEARASWLATNVIAPLAGIHERRPLLIGVDGEWWPSKAALGEGAASVPILLWAPVSKLDDLPAASEFQVLWQVEEGQEELLPWQDPTTVRETLLRIGSKRALGYLASFAEGSFANGSRRPGDGSDRSPGEFSGTGKDWFRVMLWGRLGYSPEVPGSYWQQQFSSHYGKGSGELVYNAAVHSSQVLTLLHAAGVTSGSPSQRDAGQGSGYRATDLAAFEKDLFHFNLGSTGRDLILDALSKQGLLLPSGAGGANSIPIAEALEREASQALGATEAAHKRGGWNGEENDESYRKFQSIARLGMTYTDTLRAAQLLAGFVLGGGETLRDQALRILEKAQGAIAANAPGGSDAAGDARAELSSRIKATMDLAAQMQPWRWEKTSWEIGSIPGGHAAVPSGSPNEAPVPAVTKPAETSYLIEFGSYRMQPWMSSINQQVTKFFLPYESLGSPNPGDVLVAKTSLVSKKDGWLVLRIVSDQPVTVSVNRLRASRLTPQQFPWVADSDPPPSLSAQIFSAAVQTGNNGVVIEAVASAKWPRISISHLLAPDSKDFVAIAPREATNLQGGVALTPASEGSPQAFLGLIDPGLALPGGVSQTTVPTDSPSVLYKFRVRDSGLYRLRLWSFWRTGSSSGLTVTLDGTLLKKDSGRGDAINQKWHWTPVESIADLGAGEHSLSVTGWRPGALLGTIEVRPVW